MSPQPPTTGRDRLNAARVREGGSSLPEKVAGKDQTETRRRVALLVAFVFAVFAAVTLAQAISSFLGTTNFLASATPTTGQVTGYAGSDRRNSRLPIAQFLAGDGRTYTVNATFDCGSTCPPVGGSVPVAYQPGSPSQAILSDFANAWLPAVQSLAISFIGLLITLLAFLFSRPPMRR